MLDINSQRNAEVVDDSSAPGYGYESAHRSMTAPSTLRPRASVAALFLVGAALGCKTRTSEHSTALDTTTAVYPSQRTIHFGIAWGEGAGDIVAAYFGNATFLAGKRAEPMPTRHWFRGMTTNGRAVQVIIDSVNADPESYGPTFGISLRGIHLDSGEVALFWDTRDTVAVLPARAATLDRASAELLKQRALTLHRAALPDADAVPAHDTVQFAPPDARRLEAVPDVVTVHYDLFFKRGDAIVDDRASAFFLYATPGRHLLFETFGHPEWGPDAAKVISVSPVAFFRIPGDSHIYLLARRQGAWESRGSWVIFDLPTGKPLLW
jgi:hypothetical protein